MEVSQTRKIRIEYYLVVSAPKNINSTSADKLFDLEKILDIADDLNLDWINLNMMKKMNIGI